MGNLNITSSGMESIQNLKRLRDLFLIISNEEKLIGPTAYNEIEKAMIAAMQNYEGTLVEEIFYANDFTSKKSKVVRSERTTSD